MIEKINSFEKLDMFKTVNIYTVRIKALAAVYGFKFSFASFYRQMTNGICTAVFSVLDFDITLAVDVDIADVEELSDFFKFHGYNSLLCSNRFILDSEYECGAVMACHKKLPLEYDFNIQKINDFHELADLYKFIGYGGNFDSWYADIRRRISKSATLACAVYENENIVSSAVLSSVYCENAVLTGVKTDVNFRNKGLAGAIVRYLCRAVKGTVFLMREIDKNEKFYKNLGFENVDMWRIYK